VIQLLADVNITGDVALLVQIMQSDYWREFWDYLDVRLRTFPELGLSRGEPDERVWQACQQHGLCLLTSNRNEAGPDSLGVTIRTLGTEFSLPVFTISDADVIFRSKEYATRVVESLFDFLLRIDAVRGTGRLYLP
jgi:hypothetical protein